MKPTKKVRLQELIVTYPAVCSGAFLGPASVRRAALLPKRAAIEENREQAGKHGKAKRAEDCLPAHETRTGRASRFGEEK